MMKIKFRSLIFVLCLFCVSPSYSQNLDATLVELNFVNDSDPEGFIESQSGYYFTAIDPLHGRELWFSDGTTQNTRLVKDITSGGTGSDLQLLSTLGNLLFFTKDGPSWNYDPQLWISNGTEEGTYKLKDINVGREMFTFKGKVYFQSTSEIEGIELWTSDGTIEGTMIFKDIREGNLGSYPFGFFEFNDSLFFIADDGKSGRELWKSNGTPEGTTILKDINLTNNAFYSELQILTYKQDFYFMADNGENGYELFKSNGTPEGTSMVKDINPNGDAAPFILKGAVTDQGILFGATDGQNGYELWKSDGTTNGTYMVKDITENGDSFERNFFSEKLAVLENEVFFTANDGMNGTDLWKTDGTEEGTQFVMHISDGRYSSEMHHLRSVNGNIFFLVSSDNLNWQWQLWKSDGSTSGTFALSDVELVPNLSSFNFELFPYRNKIFFDADSKYYGNELWVSDGTRAGTELFKDFNHKWGSMPNNFLDMDGLLFFSSRNSDIGNQLFMSNGSKEGTKEVKEINSTGYNSFDEDSETISVNGTVFFSANDGVHGFELWKSDGTETGTEMVKDINNGPNGSMINESYSTSFYAIDDKLYFLADDGINGKQVWISDGTTEGTKSVQNVFIYSDASDLVKLNNNIYYRTSSAVLKTDGTPGGTKVIKNLNDIRNIKVVNNRLIIVAETSGTTYGPHDLWSSDGTPEGTIHLKTFGDNIDSRIRFMTILNDELYFIAKNPESSFKAVYKTDGTIEGTQLLYDGIITGGTFDIDIDVIKTCGDYVYFMVEKENNTFSGVELWRTQGSPENTIQLTSSLDDSFYYQYLTCFQNEMFFNDALNQQEILRTNEITGDIEKINLTISGQAPPQDLIINNIVASGNILYFTGITEENGEELYAIRNGELASLPVTKEIISTDILNVKVSHETCAGKKNGILLIESSQEYPFIADINGEKYNFNKELRITDLEAGDYTVCIQIESHPEFNQCFEINIKPGGSLEAKMQTKSTSKGTLVNIDIKEGTAPFVVRLEGNLIGSFNYPSFSLMTDLNGNLEITSSRICEGTLSYQIQSNNSIVASPNPADSTLDLHISLNGLTEVPVKIYNSLGQLTGSHIYKIKNNVLTIDVQNYSPGIYYAVLKFKKPSTIKFYKK